ALFHSSRNSEELTTLEGYRERMKDDQEQIFYLTGESRAAVANSPHLEAFKDRDYEVLYFIDPVDELVVQHLSDYRGKKLKSAGKGTVELGNDEDKSEVAREVEEKSEAFGDLMELMQKHLDEHVKQVRLSSRLTASPACLVGAEHDYSPQLEKLLQLGKGAGPRQRRILELNPDHPLIERLKARFDQDAGDPLLGDCTELLMGYALVAESSELIDPVRFNQLLADVVLARLREH
ncbi:MAG: molecular chaperone HtpG, partial [Thermoanaerobaculia bacterium]